MINLNSSIFIFDFEKLNLKDKNDDQDKELDFQINEFFKLSDTYLDQSKNVLNRINISRNSNNENKIQTKQQANTFLDENIKFIEETKEYYIKQLTMQSFQKKILNVEAIEQIENKINQLKAIEKALKEKQKESIDKGGISHIRESEFINSLKLDQILSDDCISDKCMELVKAKMESPIINITADKKQGNVDLFN